MVNLDFHGFPLAATILSTAAAYTLGLFWYHPRVLGTHWMAANNTDVPLIKPNVNAMIYTMLLWLIAASFYSFMAQLLHVDSAPAFISLSCLLWVAFAMPPTLMRALYTGYPFKAVAIDAGYQLAGYYLFALMHIAVRFFSNTLHV